MPRASEIRLRHCFIRQCSNEILRADSAFCAGTAPRPSRPGTALNGHNTVMVPNTSVRADTQSKVGVEVRERGRLCGAVDRGHLLGMLSYDA